MELYICQVDDPYDDFDQDDDGWHLSSVAAVCLIISARLLLD